MRKGQHELLLKVRTELFEQMLNENLNIEFRALNRLVFTHAYSALCYQDTNLISMFIEEIKAFLKFDFNQFKSIENFVFKSVDKGLYDIEIQKHITFLNSNPIDVIKKETMRECNRLRREN